MAEGDDLKFRKLIVPHFDGAYSLAFWLTGTEADARDVLQDASLKAFRFIGSVKENPRAWFFQIVRNTSYTQLKARRPDVDLETDEDIEDPRPNAEALLIEQTSAQDLHRALAELPVAYREILILRELEELSYEEISSIIQAPVGTVMSRLSRARVLLKRCFLPKGDRV